MWHAGALVSGSNLVHERPRSASTGARRSARFPPPLVWGTAFRRTAAFHEGLHISQHRALRVSPSRPFSPRPLSPENSNRPSPSPCTRNLRSSTSVLSTRGHRTDRSHGTATSTRCQLLDEYKYFVANSAPINTPSRWMLATRVSDPIRCISEIENECTNSTVHWCMFTARNGTPKCRPLSHSPLFFDQIHNR